MDIRITLEKDERKERFYWSAKFVHKNVGEEHSVVLMEVQSDKFALTNQKEFVRCYENMTTRAAKELMKDPKFGKLILVNQNQLQDLKQN